MLITGVPVEVACERDADRQSVLHGAGIRQIARSSTVAARCRTGYQR
jgi:hypothetical protein